MGLKMCSSSVCRWRPCCDGGSDGPLFRWRRIEAWFVKILRTVKYTITGYRIIRLLKNKSGLNQVLVVNACTFVPFYLKLFQTFSRVIDSTYLAPSFFRFRRFHPRIVFCFCDLPFTKENKISILSKHQCWSMKRERDQYDWSLCGMDERMDHRVERLLMHAIRSSSTTTEWVPRRQLAR
jgi:hypothetical protein